MTKDKNVENMSQLEITKGIILNCNLINNTYYNDSKDLYIFIPNKLLVQIIHIGIDFIIKI